ncbi:recombinase family protein [Clostridium cellulovorans]|uniref:Resolvase domain n=1 Tax=Clostridium cellulovorans (strain ATCC 35296 / DSM 3052 / OCM 3 / 743B) TaxID=573061 RepID=D9SSH4_CLOC7|nr:recombinase family protein [Clostridium cellulovorans]ADL50571.1 Resolvase domain [Clostridium cellulovorans 743B]
MTRNIRKIEPLIQKMPRKKRVAAYARVSSGKDAMLHSLSAQVSYYSDLIQKQVGWEYAGVFADEALTGTKEIRPEFQRLLNECRSGNIDMVITKSISRLARNTVTMLETVRELKSLNIDVYFEKENIHSLSGDGELMLTILASFAQEESRSVSENCKWRIRKGFEAGELINLRFMYGYHIEKEKIEINESEAEIVRMIFDDYIEGIGCTLIAKKLRDMNVPKIRGGIWNSERVANIIKNEKYAGNALLQKKYVKNHLTKTLVINKGNLPMYYAEGTHPAIINVETFQRAQEIMSKNVEKYTRDNTRVKYPFTSIIVCGICGKNYRHKNTRGRISWNCSTHLKYGKDSCHSKQIPEEILISVTTEVLGLKEFDEDIFQEKIKELQVPEQNTLVFVFMDGTTLKKEWKYKSRSEGWSIEAREKARERSLKNIEGRS